MPLMTENMLFLYAMGLGLALLVIGALIKPIIKKLRDRPPPVAAIIIMAAAVFAGWVLVVSVPKTPRANTYEHAELWAVPPGEPVPIDRFGRPLLPKKPSKYLRFRMKDIVYDTQDKRTWPRGVSGMIRGPRQTANCRAAI